MCADIVSLPFFANLPTHDKHPLYRLPLTRSWAMAPLLRTHLALANNIHVFFFFPILIIYLLLACPCSLYPFSLFFAILNPNMGDAPSPARARAARTLFLPNAHATFLLRNIVTRPYAARTDRFSRNGLKGIFNHPGRKQKKSPALLSLAILGIRHCACAQ